MTNISRNFAQPMRQCNMQPKSRRVFTFNKGALSEGAHGRKGLSFFYFVIAPS